MIRKIFTKKTLTKKSTSSNNEIPDSEDIPTEFLDYINDRKDKKSEGAKEVINKVPEID
jgi:hypothetical protein